MIGRMHLHAERYRPPRGFSCRRLDGDWLFGPRFFPRSPRASAALSKAQRRIAQRTERFVREAMRAAGTSASQYGIIHADLNPQNILFARGEARPIDFDEFRRGWYLFDLAELIRTSVSPGNWRERKQLAVESYRKVRPLSDADESRFDAFLAATFVQYLNWSFEHARGPRDLQWVDFCVDVLANLVKQ